MTPKPNTGSKPVKYISEKFTIKPNTEQKKIIYGISTLEGGIVRQYPTNMGNQKKAMFSTSNAAQKAIDKYLHPNYINDFIVCVLGEEVKLIREEL